MGWPNNYAEYAYDSNGNVVGLVTGIDVQAFGAIGTADDASVIQQAIDYAASLTYGGVVTLPSGRSYNVSSISLKSKVGITSQEVGRKVNLQSVGADSGAMITNATGGLIDCSLRNLRLIGDNAHTAKWLIDIACNKAAGPDGQFTDGIFENLLLTNSRKNISIRGTVSGSGALEPFQWTTFRKVRVEGYNSATTEPLKIIGQTGQLTFEHCGFGGSGGTTTPVAVSLGPNGSVAPLDAAFNRCWIGNAVTGMTITGSTDIRVNHVYGENLTNGISFASGSTGSVDGFGMAQGTGYGIKVDGNTTKVAVGNNRLAATLAQSYYSTNGGVLVSTGFNPSGDLCSGISQQVSITGAGTTGALAVSNQKVVQVNTSAVEIQTITGNHSTGDYLTLVAQGGSIVFNSTGNVNLSGVATPMTLASGASALFIVTDLAARRYRLVSKSV